MSYLDVAKKSVGDAIDKTFLDAIVDNLADLNARLGNVEVQGLPNGSFEFDLDGDGVPDKWARTLSGSATSTLDTTAGHGRKRLKAILTSATGDRAVWTSEDYQPCSTGQRLDVRALLEASVADLHAKVEVLWFYWTGAAYAAATTASSTVWTTTDAPTTAKKVGGQVVAPAGTNKARFFRVRVTLGSDTNATAGTLYLDNVEARVYHGPVWIDRVDKGSAGTVTVTEAGDETPVAAHVVLDFNGCPDAELSGNGKTVLNGEPALNVTVPPGYFVVELNSDFEFEVDLEWEDEFQNPLSGTCYLIGYEV